MPRNQQLASILDALQLDAKNAFHRKMLVLSGSKKWCFSAIKSLFSLGSFEQALLVSDATSLLNSETVSANKLSYHLGSEYQTLIWDGFSGLNPDGLGIASGLLKGGGIFILLLPSLNILQEEPDSDYLRMCSDLNELNGFNTYFLKRLVHHLKTSEDLTLIEEHKEKHSSELSPFTSSKTTVSLPTQDQINTINAIQKVAFGHRHRPLVIKANRGRGKSSSLGLAAAKLYCTAKHNMIISAPNKMACEAAFHHYKMEIERHYNDKDDIQNALNAFKFIPLDSLLSEGQSCHILFIDEAAAIPVSTLTTLLKLHGRIVFSTTVHGYEGNGQGFDLRFKKTLNELRPNWKELSLTTPIRWADNDPLEAWFFHFLLLNAELSKPKLFKSQDNTRETRLIDQAELAQNEGLLEEIFSLLVIAHYQTSPSDLRLILDHPKLKILASYDTLPSKEICHSSGHLPTPILGVCLLLEEGGLVSNTLAEDIISGKRRPRGHLFPQSLCALTANNNCLKQTTYRIMRIAVHPLLQNQGIGSNLLTYAQRLAKSNNIDSLSTSYGLSKELLGFWHKNHFEIVKLGLKVDGASGLQSIMMMQPISISANTLFYECRELFKYSFLFNLNRQSQHLEPNLITAILQNLSHIEFQKHPGSLNKILAFAKDSRPYDDTEVDIFNFVLTKVATPIWNCLTKEQQELLVIKVLQNRNQNDCLKYFKLNGKKQLDLALREAVNKLLS